MNGELNESTGGSGRPLISFASSLVRATIFGAFLVASTWASSTSASGSALTPAIERTTAQPQGKVNWYGVGSPSSMILEIRRLSGLTWSELGDLFSVTRRSVHAWAAGGPMSVSREQKVARVLQLFRYMNVGDVDALRRYLRREDVSGPSLFERIRAGDLDSVPVDDFVGALPRTRLPSVKEIGKNMRGATVADAVDLDQTRPLLPAKRARVVSPVRPQRT